MDFCFQLGGDRRAAVPRRHQGVGGGVQHFTVVHGAFFPVGAVGQHGVVQVFGQAVQRQALPVALPKIDAQQEQPVVLDRAPVAQLLEGRVRRAQVFPVGAQARLGPFQQRRGHGPVKQGQGAQPVFGPQARLQRAPGGLLGFRRVGHMVEPVLQQRQEGIAVAGFAGVAPGFAQVQKDRVPVQGIDPFGVAVGAFGPVQRQGVGDGFGGALHLPVVQEAQFPAADLVGAVNGRLRGLRAKLPHRGRGQGRVGPKHRSVHEADPSSCALAKRAQRPAQHQTAARLMRAMASHSAKTALQPQVSAATPTPQVAAAAPR